ncbi:MAG: hypothetical protein ABL879_06875, partial [Devosia sp.]
GGVPLPDVDPWSEIDLLNFERDTMGLFLTGHPIDRWAADLKEFGARSIADVSGQLNADLYHPAHPDHGPDGDRHQLSDLPRSRSVSR